MLIAFFFFFNDTATTEIYTLSLHDALPIYQKAREKAAHARGAADVGLAYDFLFGDGRSEEHTSELQSPCNLVCRLLLEKKKLNRFVVYSLNCQPPKTISFAFLLAACSQR